MAKMSEFGKAFAAARKRGDKTFEFKGKKFTTQTKEEKDREVTPEAKKVMDTMRRDRESNFRNQVRKSDVAMETPEERASMNLAGFKRDKESGYSPFKKGGMTKMKSGGYVKAADGCAKKGKTKGRMV